MLHEPTSEVIPQELIRRVVIVEINDCMQIEFEKTTTIVENYKFSLKPQEESLTK